MSDLSVSKEQFELIETLYRMQSGCILNSQERRIANGPSRNGLISWYEVNGDRVYRTTEFAKKLIETGKLIVR